MTITTEGSRESATTWSRMNLFGYVGHVTIINVHYCVLFSRRVRIRIGLGLDLASVWLVVMHTYLCYFGLDSCHTPHG